MATINIAGLTPVNDPAYRYKMPRIVGKVEGRGNGIKTVLMNVKEVADSLNREAPELTKFFGCELGAQTTYAGDTDRAIVNGSHRDVDLQTHMSKYIENFVLCRNCRLPETHYKIKDGLISQKCLACGHKEACDMTHKLTTFILAQHKKNKELQKAAEKKDKKDGKDKKEKDKTQSADQEDSNKDSKDKKEKKDKKSKDREKETEEEREQRKREKKDKKQREKESAGDGQEGSGKADGQTEASVFSFDKQRSNSPDHSQDSSQDDDDESDAKFLEEGIDRFKLYLQHHPDSTVAMQLDELRNIQIMNSLQPSDRMLLYLGATFPDNYLSANPAYIQLHKASLSALASGEIQQRQLLAAFEWLASMKHPATAKHFAKALMQLYDEEVVDEEVFFSWHGDVVVNAFSATRLGLTYDMLEALKDNAKPFITWLQEAEEDDSGAEGEEDEEEDDED